MPFRGRGDAGKEDDDAEYDGRGNGCLGRPLTSKGDQQDRCPSSGASSVPDAGRPDQPWREVVLRTFAHQRKSGADGLMSTKTPVRIKDRRTGEFADAELVEGLGKEDVDAAEAEWKPFLDKELARME